MLAATTFCHMIYSVQGVHQQNRTDTKLLTAVTAAALCILHWHCQQHQHCSQLITTINILLLQVSACCFESGRAGSHGCVEYRRHCATSGIEDQREG